MDNVQYGITVRKGDYEVSVHGDKDWVELKFKELFSESLGESVLKAPRRSAELPATLGEFLDEKGNPKKHTDVVAVYGYWLFKKEKFTSFNARDITGCYDSTRRPKPKNVNAIIDTNVASHIFAEATEKKNGKKAWVITRPGEDHVVQMR